MLPTAQKKQQLTPLFLIIKKLLLVFYGPICDQLSRNSRAKACNSTAESRVARPFKVLFARKLLEEWKHPSRLYNQKHLIPPVFFSCSGETTSAGMGKDIYEVVTERVEGSPKQSWGKICKDVLSDNLRFEKSGETKNKKKRYRVKFFPPNWLLQIDPTIL